jgi:hypothetical protein
MSVVNPDVVDPPFPWLIAHRTVYRLADPGRDPVRNAM